MRTQIAAVCATALAFGSLSALADTPRTEQSQRFEDDPGQTQRQGEEEAEAGRLEAPGAAEAGTRAQQRSVGEEEQQAEMQRTAGQDVVSFDRLSVEQRRELQRKLQNEGHYRGNIDGILGPKTVGALHNFQAQEGLSASGALTMQTADRLGLDLSGIQRVRGTEQEGEAQGARSGAQGEQTGVMGAATPTLQESIQLSALDGQQAVDLQRKLQESGDYQGKIDGLIGPQTKAALRSYFQKRAQLASRGQITQEDAQAMGLNVSDIQPVRGADVQQGGERQMQRGQEERPREPGQVEQEHEAEGSFEIESEIDD
jgi:peptidoglycan hydrolase-like protein with peptidoglycan-binding domain